MSDTLARLAHLIDQRRDAPASGSYTRQLLDGGTRRCAKKFGEEAVELVIAALAEDSKAITSEAADVLYHLMVLLSERRVPFDAVLAVLAMRLGTSGLDEKAARSASG